LTVEIIPVAREEDGKTWENNNRKHGKTWETMNPAILEDEAS
jgi:hypothetical protein